MASNDDTASNFFENGKQITASVTVQKPASEVYRLLSGIVGLPQFVSEVGTLGPRNGNRIEGTARAGDESFSWEAEIIREEMDRLFAWRTVGDPPVPHAGSVSLRELPFKRGTSVKVIVDYVPGQTSIGQSFERELGKNPEAFLQATLFRFRELLEAGEVATTKGQPAGADRGRDVEGSKDEQKFSPKERA
ncbi:MAG: hypothetical protein SFY69_04745 [Planctomycetota bacterium]|nr:hypothetical protein [Planctomycetota bacterium]